MKCGICDVEKSSIAKLSKHIRDQHGGMKSKTYYDRYLKLPDEGICKICGGPTRFVTLGEGYKQTCSQSCRAKLFRQELKNDSDRFENFSKKVKRNQRRIWKDRSLSGEDIQIRVCIGETNRVKYKQMSSQERKERFGWINKIPSHERTRAIEKVTAPLRKYYETENEEQKQARIDRGIENKRKNGKITVQFDMKKWRSYQSKVRSLTEKTYRKFRHVINPLGYERGRGIDKYHLDHRLSIFDGFQNGVLPEIVASTINLRMISAFENLVKHNASSITVEELMEQWENGQK